jgi:predicted MFS family arabinose efflux permease
LGTLAFAFGSKILIGYFPNYAVLQNGLAWSESQTGLAIFIFGVGQFLAYVLGSFFRNSLRLLYWVIFGIALLYLPLLVVTDMILISIILFCLGLCIGTTYFISLELTLKYESGGKGAKAGWFESMVGLGTGIGPLIAGKIAEIQLQAPFLFVCVVVVGLLGIMLVLDRVRIQKVKRKKDGI